jgi:hypothetical protein
MRVVLPYFRALDSLPCHIVRHFEDDKARYIRYLLTDREIEICFDKPVEFFGVRK